MQTNLLYKNFPCKNDIDIEKNIIDNITVYVFSIQLLIKNDNYIYHFKSENECNNFINSLKEYNKNIITNTKNEIIKIDKITDNQVLQDKIKAYRLDRELKDREAKKKAELKITSRSSDVRVSNLTSSRHPLDSYTYISSKFGQRSRSFHTGVDFATPIGTEVHA